jgi:hypothetical protein
MTNDDLQNFALNFEDEIVKPLLSAGFERNKYNVFDILNIGRQELRHSDFLAFLMNPNRSGEVGQQFLRNFLALLSKENPELHLDFFKVFYGEFEKVIVRREYKKIDILLEIEIQDKPQNKQYVFAIENKVDADEQMYDNDDDENKEGQLVKYKDTIDKEYNNYHKRIFLFLSPDKRTPSESDWIPIDYNLIYSALCRLDLNTADNTLKTLINDYKKMISSQFIMEDNKELKEQALNIYSKNKDIFDFIFKSRPNRVNTTARIIRDFLHVNGDWIEFDKNKFVRQNTYIIFTTKELKELGLDIIKFQIDVKNMYLYFYIDGEDSDLRKKLGKKATLEAIRHLLNIFSPATVTDKDIYKALDLDWDDFEDSVQFTVGESFSVDYIISRNTQDFSSGTIPAVTPEQFIQIISNRVCL